MKKEQIYIYTFYRFKALTNIELIKQNLDRHKKNKKILGTILIAAEGINGNISGTKKDLENFITLIKKTTRIRKIMIKISKNQFIPFYRLKIRIKKEIVTLGNKSAIPEKRTGKNISPEKWDNIINDNKYLIIDARNNYEVDIGSFQNAINPKTNSFREFPDFIKKLNISKKKPIAMFCTGGIRCEKASSYLINEGYKNIFQLEGGIINYLEYKKNKKNNTWNGECFVFDNRVAVNKDLQIGKYLQCYGCRHPITTEDTKLRSYIKGVSCKYCVDTKSEKKKLASKTRQNQIDIAERKSINHPFKKIY
jgi:UPF0176 protein